MISIYSTFKDEEEARKIARHLVEKRLIACANLFPLKSIYRWKGKITEESEYAMLAKATKKNFARIRQEIKEMHSYEVPCIVALNIQEKDDEFAKWVQDESS